MGEYRTNRESEEVAQRFRVSVQMVKKLLQQRRKTSALGNCHATPGARPRSCRRIASGCACRTVQGATNISVFQAYVREVLVPTLRHGDLVVLDNLGAHKNEYPRALILAAGAQVRFLPAYSPDFNPIEMMWRRSKPCCGRAQAPGRRASVNSGGSGASAAKACLRPPNSYSKRVESECRKRRFAP